LTQHHNKIFVLLWSHLDLLQWKWSNHKKHNLLVDLWREWFKTLATLHF